MPDSGNEQSGRPPRDREETENPLFKKYAPGVNAFKIQELEKEQHRMRTNAFYQAEKQRESRSRANSRSSTGRTSTEHNRQTSATTFSQFINDEDVHPVFRMATPQKKRDHSTDRKRPAALDLEMTDKKMNEYYEKRRAREAHASQGKKSVEGGQRPPQKSVHKLAEYGINPTARAAIEAKNERKLFDMMGVPLSTPPTYQPTKGENTVTIQKHDRTKEKASVSRKDSRKETLKDESSKKRFLGMNLSMPTFRSDKGPPPPMPSVQARKSIDDPSPHIPPKAAAILGSTYGNKTGRVGIPAKVKLPPSQHSIVGKTVTSKRMSDPFHDGNISTAPKLSRVSDEASKIQANNAVISAAKQRLFAHKSPGEARLQAADPAILSVKEHPRFRELLNTPEANHLEGQRKASGSLPPTPPDKDTPPEVKQLVQAKISEFESKLARSAGPEEDATPTRCNTNSASNTGIPATGNSHITLHGDVNSGQAQYTSSSNSHASFAASMGKPEHLSGFSHAYSAPTANLTPMYSNPLTTGQPPGGRWSAPGKSGHEENRYHSSKSTPAITESEEEVRSEYSGEYAPHAPDKTETEDDDEDKTVLLPTFYTPSNYGADFPEAAIRPSQNFDDKIYSVKQLGEVSSPRLASQTSHITEPSNASQQTIPFVFQGHAAEITTSDTAADLPHKLGIAVVDSDMTAPSATTNKDKKKNRGSAVEGAPRVSDSVRKLRADVRDVSAESAPDPYAFAHQVPQQTPQRNRVTDPGVSMGLTPYIGQGNFDSPVLRRFQSEAMDSTGSAVPSPLHPQNQWPMMPAGAHSMHSLHDDVADPGLLTHFHIINEHMEDLAKQAHEEATRNHQAMEMKMSKHTDHILAQLNARAGEVKEQVQGIQQKSDANTQAITATQAANGTQLDKLVERLEKGVVKPMEKLASENKTLLSEIAKLAKKVDDLERKVSMPPPPPPQSTTPLQDQMHNFIPSSQPRSGGPESHQHYNNATGYMQFRNAASGPNGQQFSVPQSQTPLSAYSDASSQLNPMQQHFLNQYAMSVPNLTQAYNALNMGSAGTVHSGLGMGFGGGQASQYSGLNMPYDPSQRFAAAPPTNTSLPNSANSHGSSMGRRDEDESNAQGRVGPGNAGRTSLEYGGGRWDGSVALYPPGPNRLQSPDASDASVSGLTYPGSGMGNGMGHGSGNGEVEGKGGFGGRS